MKQFIDAYVKTALKLFPNALLHWEDFGNKNARNIMSKYNHKIQHLMMIFKEQGLSRWLRF